MGEGRGRVRADGTRTLGRRGWGARIRACGIVGCVLRQLVSKGADAEAQHRRGMGAVAAQPVERCEDECPFHRRRCEADKPGHRERIGFILPRHEGLERLERQLLADPNCHGINKYPYGDQRNQNGHLPRRIHWPKSVAHPHLQLKRHGSLPYSS